MPLFKKYDTMNKNLVAQFEAMHPDVEHRLTREVDALYTRGQFSDDLDFDSREFTGRAWSGTVDQLKELKAIYNLSECWNEFPADDYYTPEKVAELKAKATAFLVERGYIL